jgi:hypothetical protein
MSRLLHQLSTLWFVLCAGSLGLIVPTSLIVSEAHAAAPVLPACAWPVVSNGENFLNVATPDTNTTYWLIPIDLRLWPSVIFRGTYPHARAFNFTTYTATGSLIGTIADAQIRPDAGSVNPFAAPSPTPQTYTVAIIGIGGAANSLNGGGGGLVFVIYRVIVPDQGLNRAGGVDLPSVAVRGAGGTQQLHPCPFMQAELIFRCDDPDSRRKRLQRNSGFSRNDPGGCEPEKHACLTLHSQPAGWVERRPIRTRSWDRLLSKPRHGLSADIELLPAAAAGHGGSRLPEHIFRRVCFRSRLRQQRSGALPVYVQ